jgi:hypothetical protein
MKKSELFQILSDPNCDPKYIVKALRLYNPDEIIKIPAISLRFLYRDEFPTNYFIDLWFWLIKEVDTLDRVEASYTTLDSDLNYYLQAHYAKSEILFFANMGHITTKGLLNKLIKKFKALDGLECISYKKQCAFSLYAYDLLSKTELCEIIKNPSEPIDACVGFKTSKRIERCGVLAEKIYKKSKNYELIAEFISTELVSVSGSFTRMLLTEVRKTLNLHANSKVWQTLLQEINNRTCWNVDKHVLSVLDDEQIRSRFVKYTDF